MTIFPLRRLGGLLSLALAMAPATARAAGNAAAETVFELGGIPITNSMVTGWVISLLIIVLVRIAGRLKAAHPKKAF